MPDRELLREKVIKAVYFRYLQMSGPQSLLTCAADGRGAVVAMSFCGPKHPYASFVVLRVSHIWSSRTSHVPGSRPLPMVRISFAMRWRPRCCTTAPRWLKLAMYCGIAAPRLRRFIRASISIHYAL